MAVSGTQLKVNTGHTPSTLTWSLVAGFVSFGVNHGAGYVLQQHACSVQSATTLHVLTLVCAMVSLSGFVAGWKIIHALPPEKDEEGGEPHDRAHFQALLGVGFSLVFTLMIVAESVPRWLLPVCS
jgi:hypothetical protein